MDRSQGVTVAVASLLIGIGAVLVGLLSPTASIAIAAVSFATGVYLLVGGVYLGKWTPATYLDRVFRPRLEDATASITDVDGATVFLQFCVSNRGREQLDAVVNVTVPRFVTQMYRCGEDGVIGREEHKGSFSRLSKEEHFWNGNISLSGRDERYFFFRAELTKLDAISVRLRINAAVLTDPFVATFLLTPQAVRLERDQELEPGGPGS